MYWARPPLAQHTSPNSQPSSMATTTIAFGQTQTTSQHQQPQQQQGNRVLLSSKLRNIAESPNTNSFTINLSQPLYNVTLVRVCGIDVPITGHAINNTNDCLYFSESQPGFDETLFEARIPWGTYTASDLMLVLSTCARAAKPSAYQVGGSPATGNPKNVYYFTYEGAFTNTVSVTATNSDAVPFTLHAPNTSFSGAALYGDMYALDLNIVTWNPATSTLTLTTKTPTHGIATGDILRFVSLNASGISFSLSNISLSAGSTSNPDSNVIILQNLNNIQWPFASNVLDAVGSSGLIGVVVSAAMDRNISRFLGFTTSSKPTANPIIGIYNKSTENTVSICCAYPHRLSLLQNSRFAVVGANGTVLANNVPVSAVPNTFTVSCLKSNYDPSIDLQGAFIYGQSSSSLIYNNIFATQKIDLSSFNRNVLVRCILNNVHEIGNVFLPSTNMRFLSRVQMKQNPGSIQFQSRADQAQDVFLLSQPIGRLLSVRLELYSEVDHKLYNLQGAEWTMDAEFFCDNSGNI